MKKISTRTVYEDVEKPNGEIVFRKVQLHAIDDYVVNKEDDSKIEAMLEARRNDDDCKGFAVAREDMGDTVRYVFVDIHPDHVARFEDELVKHEKPTTLK